MDNVLKRIKKKNNINEKFYRDKVGKGNDFVYTSFKYVIKIFTNKINYENEKKIYLNLNNRYIPELISCGEIDGQHYILMSKLDAKPLTLIWKNIGTEDKKKVSLKVFEILQSIHKIKNEQEINFADIIKQRYVETLTNTILPLEMQKTVNEIFNEKIQYFLEQEELKLIYKDCNMNNILYNGKDVFLIDFSDIEHGPLDYQFNFWNRLSKYPDEIYNIEDRKYLDSTVYKEFKVLMEENFSEVKTICNYDKKLELYWLLDELKMINNRGQITETFEICLKNISSGEVLT